MFAVDVFIYIYLKKIKELPVSQKAAWLMLIVELLLVNLAMPLYINSSYPYWPTLT